MLGGCRCWFRAPREKEGDRKEIGKQSLVLTSSTLREQYRVEGEMGYYEVRGRRGR